MDGVLRSAPVWFRFDGSTLWLVGSGASPVGEDHIRVHIDVGRGVDVTVRSVAATVVYAARGSGTRWDTVIEVAEDARLDWRPEPLILTERARHLATTTVHADRAADVLLEEVFVLGRTDEVTGALCSTLDVRIDGAPVLLTSTDTSVPGWAGPAGVGGAPIFANRLRLGPVAPPGTAEGQHRGAVLEPAPGCRLAVATATDLAAARASLEVLLGEEHGFNRPETVRTTTRH